MNSPAIALLFAAALTLPACEKAPPPPPPKNSGGLSGLSDNPTSLLGKSAKSGKDAAKSIEDADAQAGALADEITGQAVVTQIGGLEFPIPKAWVKAAPANSMQTAAYKIGESTCVFLTGIAGSVSANIDRWKAAVTDPATGQPADMRTRTATVGGMKVSLVWGAGTYSSMATGASVPQPGSGFRGAIIEAGPSIGNIFVRLNGPEAEVASTAAAWEQMVLGVRKP